MREEAGIRKTNKVRRPDLACVLTIIMSLASPIHTIPVPSVAYADEPSSETGGEREDNLGASVTPDVPRESEAPSDVAVDAPESPSETVDEIGTEPEEESVAYPAYDSLATFRGSDEDEERMPSVRMVADEGILPEGVSVTVMRDGGIESEATDECVSLFPDTDDMGYEMEPYGIITEFEWNGEEVVPNGDIRLVLGIRPEDHDHVVAFRKESGRERLSRQDVLIDESRNKMLTMTVPARDAGLPVAVVTVWERPREHADGQDGDDKAAESGDSDDEGDRRNPEDGTDDRGEGDGAKADAIDDEPTTVTVGSHTLITTTDEATTDEDGEGEATRTAEPTSAAFDVTSDMTEAPAAPLPNDLGMATGAVGSDAVGTVSSPSDPMPDSAIVSHSEKGMLTAMSPRWKVTVEYGDDAEIPDGATLSVSEVTGDEADRYEGIAKDALAPARKVGVAGMSFLDISIISNGREMQPKAPVHVSVSFVGSAMDASDVSVVHFDESKRRASAEVIDSEAQEPESTCTIGFETDGFSVFGFGSIVTMLTEWLTTLAHFVIYGTGDVAMSSSPFYSKRQSVNGLAEGMTLLDAYDVTPVGQMMPSWVSVALGIPVDTGTRGSVGIWSTSGGRIGSLIEDGLSPQGGDQIVGLDGADGFAVVLDTGYRRSELTLTASDGASVSLEGMLPKESEATVTPVTEQNDGAVAAYDIGIADPQGEYQPDAEHPVTVSVTSDDIAEAIASGLGVDVIHVRDDGTEEAISGVRTEGDTVSFSATGFSVYIIKLHEGGDVVTPRVEFHFIDKEPVESSGTYSAGPYNFYNKANELQSSQILKDGEALEMIANPSTIRRENADGSTTERFFYGWYDVNASSDTTAWNRTAGRWGGVIRYSWPAEPHKLPFNQAVSVTPDDDTPAEGETLRWSISWEENGEQHSISGEGTMDPTGKIDAYFAPIYEDYYFVNFRLGTRSETTGASLDKSLLTRKLVVFGSDPNVLARIGDVVAPSPDPQHKVFIGWETAKTVAGTLQRDKFYQTIDRNGNEISEPVGRDGYYVSLARPQVGDENYGKNYYDFYPVFAEARWLYFNTGRSGNGATYVSAKYLLTDDEGLGTGYEGLGAGEKTSSRNGYVLDGWYADAAKDASTGDITNMSVAQAVTLRIRDDAVSVGDAVTGINVRTGNDSVPASAVNVTEDGIISVSYAATATKILNADGTIGVGEGFGKSVTYTVNGQTKTVTLYDVRDGELRFYKAIDDLTVHANWILNDDTTCRVIVWKQKVTDDKNAADADKRYDYEIFYTKDDASTAEVPNLGRFSGTYVDSDGNEHQVSNLNLLNLTSNTPSYLTDFTGFHYARNDAEEVGAPSPDGTSVYNVYYDRNPHHLTFQVDDSGSGYNYTVTTSNAGTQYAFVNGEPVQLSYENGKWYIPEYGDVYTQDDTNGTYGLVDGEYVELTPVTSQTTTYTADYRYTATTGNNGTQYGIDSHHDYVILTRTTRLYTEFNGTPNGNTTYYGYYDGEFVELYYNNRTWYRNREWGWIGYNYVNPYDGIVYTRGNPNSGTYYYTDEGRYTGPRYTRSNDNSTDVTNNPSLNTENLYYVDGNGGQVPVTPRTTTTVTGYTYDDNGVATDYDGTHRYIKGYEQTGEMTEYHGTRYTRSGLTNSWYTTYVIEALYGQTISDYFPIPGYNNGERWEPQSNNQGWSQVMVIVDTMPDEDVTFRLDESNRPLKTMNYYVEALPRETNTITYAGRQFKLHGEPVGARYNGVTSEDFSDITGFTKLGWTDANGNSNPYSSTFYIYSTTQNQTINFFYTRDQYNLTFDVNYPNDVGVTYDGVTVADGGQRSENLTVEGIYYQALLSQYGSTVSDGKTNWYYGIEDDENTAQHELVAPDHYIFGGWYEDASCTVPFDFGSTMPVGNKIVYAKWTPEVFLVRIDPNGGEIDHINHGFSSNYGGYPGRDFAVFNRSAIAGERVADYGYDRTQATYVNVTYGDTMTEYVLKSRTYVPISDEVASGYDGQIYYYVNAQYVGPNIDGDPGIPSDCRNALYMTEDELHDYWQFQNDWIGGNLEGGHVTGTQQLDFDTWKSVYVQKQDGSSEFQKFRRIAPNEHYQFLGWYKVDADGNTEQMPYNFSDPVTDPLTLRAVWRLDGGYKVQYHADYYVTDGVINGSMASWIDPPSSAGELSYADGAPTSIYKAPESITLNDEETEEYVFRGFRLVSVTYDGTGSPVYTPLESGVFYDPGDSFTIRASLAVNGYIHMQAVYEPRDSSYRRPYVTNLTLDANGGYLTTGTRQGEGGAISAGERLTENLSLTQPSGWNGIGTVSATKTYEDEQGVTHTVDQIEFGDIQSDVAVHLYRYATTLTHAGDDPDGELLDPPGTNYFSHPDGYYLLGFDDAPNEGDYVATYPADSVVSVQRRDDATIYAVWEPMVYLNVRNETGKDVTFAMSSPNSMTLYALNEVAGAYDRNGIRDLSHITVRAGETIRLAVPYGDEQQVTISGANDLGVGKILTWDTSLTDGAGTVYDTQVAGEPIQYQHSSGDTHVLARGHVGGAGRYSFDERLLFNKEGTTVTFRSKDSSYALLLDANWEDGTTQEYDYDFGDVTPQSTQELPHTSTRVGWEFLGWAYSPDATTPDFSGTSADGWTIPNLYDFFNNDNRVHIESEGNTKVATLYAVWSTNTTASTVYVYKDVPLPGSRRQAFDFTLDIGARYEYSTGGYWPQTHSEDISASGTFQLTHGDYAVIHSMNDTSQGKIVTTVTVKNANGVTKTDSTGTLMVQTIVAQASDTVNNGSLRNVRIEVSETPVDHYDTSVTRVAQTTGNSNSIYLGENSDVTTNPLTVSTSEAHWEATDAGGTLVFTNTRQTHDVTIRKTLVSNTTAPGTFSFSASYELDGVTTTLDPFSVTSGTDGRILRDLPAGAVLSVTEANDGSYDTEMSSSAGLADKDGTDGATFTTDVVADDTITFANTLKSYPVRFVKVDQDGNPNVNAMFSLTGPTGSLGSALYARSQDNGGNGEFYATNRMWVGEYTLTETVTPSGYHGLDGPVAISVTGDGVSCQSDDVAVTGNADDGYVVSVHNQRVVNVTVSKELVDPLITQREFTYTATYSYMSHGQVVTKSETLTFPSSGTATVTVPLGATVTVTEQDSDNAYAIYDVTNKVGDGEYLTGTTNYSRTLTGVSGDSTITFRNVRKTIDVTVRKLVHNNMGDPLEEFGFTVTLANGAQPVRGYQMATGLVSDADGRARLALTNNGARTLTIPYGSTFTVAEDSLGERARVSVSVNDGTPTQATSVTLTRGQTTQNLTVSFTNDMVLVVPSGVASDTKPYAIILLVGTAVASPALRGRARRKRDEGGDSR